MASVYKIKRKYRKGEAKKSAELLTDLDLTEATAPKSRAADVVIPLAEVTHNPEKDPPAPEIEQPEEAANEEKEAKIVAAETKADAKEPFTVKSSLFEDAAKKAASEEPFTIKSSIFENAADQAKDAASPAREGSASFDMELIRQLSEEAKAEKDVASLSGVKPGEIDFAKLDAVFGHNKGSLSGEDGQKEFDETTALLMEVFGSDSEKKKKKKKKETQPAAEPSEIRAVFNEETGENGDTAEKAESVQTEQAPDETQAFYAIKSGQDNDYVAIHDGAEEKTREYSGSLTDALDAIKPETTVTETPKLAEEMRVPDSDSPYNDTYDELENTGKTHLDVLPEEYTSREQYDEFAEHLRNKNFRSLINCVWLFLLFGLVMYLESATFSHLYHPAFLSPGGTYNIIYLLVDVQLIFISALFQLPSLGNGFKRLFTGKADRNSIAFLSLLFAATHAILLIAFPTETYPLFGSVALLVALLNGVADYLDNKRLYRTFRITAADHAKYVGENVAGDSAESEAFRELLPGEQKICTVQRAEFIDDFFKRANETPRSQKVYGWVIILSILLSAGFAVFHQMREPGVAGTVNAFMTAIFMTLPLCGVFTLTLPQAHVAKKAEKRDAAIVSLAAAEEYARASVVSFTDKEIFPAKYVKVTTIRTYGQTRIDKAILYAAMIFQKLGGPLSQVFKKTISGVYEEISEDFDFLEITADGMCAKLEGKDVFVGNKDYMLSYDFGYPKDAMDDDFESRSGKIMYMVIGAELAAKFYIRYSVSSRFKKTLVSLYKCGICPAVKTCDPNIDTNLLQNLLKSDKIPAGIIKTTDAMKDAPVMEKSRSGVVCTSSIAGLLQAFVLCDSLKNLVRNNAVIKILSLLIGAGVVVFLYFAGNLGKIDTTFALIYQLLWLLPVLIPNVLD